MKARLALLLGLVALALAAAPSIGSATSIPGPNGKIAFASGRGNSDFPSPIDGDDTKARIWVADYPGGTPVQVTTLPKEAQHRHPDWSPDHTEIVYAAGVAFSGEYALWIKNLVTGASTEFVPTAKAQDRPSWSPDGTEIAYGSQGDLWVKPVDGGAAVRITETAGIQEERPVWSPDGKTLYYNRGVPPFNAGEKRDIYAKSPVTLAGAETPVVTGTTDDWQPAVSPDGKRLCFLRGAQDETADLWTVSVTGSPGPAPFATTANGELNCVWSPDGTHVLYSLGAFGAGELLTRDVNGNNPTALGAMNVAKHFDGNADWATNFSPECEPRSATTGVNQFVAVRLGCVDPDHGFGAEPPEPEAIEADGMEIVSQPQHGTIGAIGDSGTVIYTPNKGFAGSDGFTYTASDGTSEAKPAKITISVTGPAGGGGGATGAADTTAPRISAVRVSAKRWVAGSKLATFSRSPVGTTISFKLSEAARATISFQRQKTIKGRKRFLSAGAIAFDAKSGANKARFQGRLTKAKALAPGAYRVVVGAKDAAGNSAKPKTGPTFTILSP
jgi:dipeptidyl aminopeptidase/acylaminoacyl peptidase